MNRIESTLASAIRHRVGRSATLILTAGILAACATGPSSPPGAAEVRDKFESLQADPELSERARVELREAEVAVTLAERPLANDQAELGAHRVYMADRKVEVARAMATTRHAESQRDRLGEERDRLRLAARTQEADSARADAETSRSEAERARTDAASARREALAARAEEEASASERTAYAAELQRQIDTLKAEATERGIVLTLGDVLFATASSTLQSGAGENLDKLVAFLEKYPERRAQIEGHTDNVGSPEYNQTLSLQRAKSVREYLTDAGIPAQRLGVAGMGLDKPIADNDSGLGRQRNRRVEVVIDNLPEPIAPAD